MRILVTNDDGVHAPGLEILQEIAAELSDDVWTVAPETDQSGAAHSLTLAEPLRLRQLAERTYAVRGTPTDCVIMAVKKVLEGQPKPDLVLSGVNRGSNMADDVTYSGTVAGAMEGAVLGIPSIALSLAVRIEDPEGTPKWRTPALAAPPLLKQLLAAGWPQSVLINVNFPDRLPERIAGTVVTSQGKRDQDVLMIVDRMDMRGNPYYWFGFERRRSNPPEGTDLWAIYNGYISVTPLHLDLTHHATRRKLAGVIGG
jgi:5'-nucleotidase